MPSLPLALPATFYRGGSCKAVCFTADVLPADRSLWPAIFSSVMGSPDPNGRQLDGMGGGISSVSKVVVIEKSSREDADVDYTAYQIGIKIPDVDTVANCGNMAAAVGPFALEKGLLGQNFNPTDAPATVRIFNVNTGKIMVSHFPVILRRELSDPVLNGILTSFVPHDVRYIPQLAGDFEIQGVSGSGARITLDFMKPAGAISGRLLPTGNPVDLISAETVPGYSGKPIRASVIDCSTPTILVEADSLGIDGSILPTVLDGMYDLREWLEEIRRAGTVLMGMAARLNEVPKYHSAPKVGFVSSLKAHTTLSGSELQVEDADITIRIISAGDPHRALPITSAICIAGAAAVPGTVVHQAWLGSKRTRGTENNIIIAHPSGTTIVGSELEQGVDGVLDIQKGTVYTTARKLMEGVVYANV